MVYRFLHGRSAVCAACCSESVREHDSRRLLHHIELSGEVGENVAYDSGLPTVCCMPTAFFMCSYAASGLPSASYSSAMRA
jgi:hypothetical protein